MVNDITTTERLILVAGATGYVGGLLVPKLMKKGYRVRCLVRDTAGLKGKGWNGIEVMIGDVLDYSSLVSALQNIDTAYYLVH